MPRPSTAPLQYSDADGIIALATEESPAQRSGERDCWLAVIEQTMRDAKDPHYAGSHTEGQRLKESARRWLLKDRTDYPFVCELAGVDPDGLRARTKRVLQ